MSNLAICCSACIWLCLLPELLSLSCCPRRSTPKQSSPPVSLQVRQTCCCIQKVQSTIKAQALAPFILHSSFSACQPKACSPAPSICFHGCSRRTYYIKLNRQVVQVLRHMKLLQSNADPWCWVLCLKVLNPAVHSSCSQVNVCKGCMTYALCAEPSAMHACIAAESICHAMHAALAPC